MRSIPVVLLLLSAAAASAIPPERVLLSDNFDDTLNGPMHHWQPLDGEWLVAQRTTPVFRQANEDITSDSWVVALWANYTVTTKCVAEEGEGPWGIGATAYDDGLGRAYRLRLGDGRVYVEKLNGGDVRVLGEAEAKVAQGKWYSLRLTLTSAPGATTLQGKVWGSDEEEPKEWLLRADDAADAYAGGSVGLWTGSCAGRFSYLSVKQQNAGAERSGEVIYGTDFTDAAQGRLPVFWASRGGLWVRDVADKLPLLRQMLSEAGPQYDENAYAYVQLTGYTVTAQAIAHPGPGKWGVGVVGYHGLRGSNYRLRTLDNRAFLVKRRVDGRLENLAAVNVPLKRGQWYNLKLALDNLRGSVRLQGKVWLVDEEEPVWQLTAYDRDQPLYGGAPGLWCFGTAVDFDNFSVRTSTLSALNESLQ